MKHLFLKITERLDTIQALNWVDEDKGQMNFERPPVSFPAALVDINEPRRSNLNHRLQDVNAVITVSLCMDFTGHTNTSTPEAARATSLRYYDLAEEIYTTLQGWGDGFNELECINKRKVKRPDGYVVLELSFTTEYHDSTALVN